MKTTAKIIPSSHPTPLWAVLLLAISLAGLQPAKAESSVTLLDRGLYRIQVEGFINNLLLVSPDHVVLCDTAYPGYYPLLSSLIDTTTPGRPVDTLITTHWHQDHTGLNADFRLLEGAESIVAHWRTGVIMAEDQFNEDLGAITPAAPLAAQPTLSIHGCKTFRCHGENILLKTIENAHSGADLAVYFEQANVLYAGDLYFGKMFPFIDRSTGGSIQGMIRAGHQLLALMDNNTILVPSHGPLGDQHSLREFIQMLETCRARVHTLIADGLTEDQAIAAEPLADLAPGWGQGFVNADLFTLIIYRDLAPHHGGNMR